MNSKFQDIIVASTGSKSLHENGVIQSLWSGYGKIVRYSLKGGKTKSVVVKHVKHPDQGGHPRGWNSDLSHERKLKSYEVEMAFYRRWAERCDESCRVPHCFAQEVDGEETLMVLEDLNEVGYPSRVQSVSMVEIEVTLQWLANFHATFMGDVPEELWEIGTYWHLDTRPDELEVLKDYALKEAASVIDRTLQNSPYQTFVHGDAKLANFCYSKDGTKVSAVDFQYIGGGCGMKDVAYFISSCLYEDDCEAMEEELLTIYFDALKKALVAKGKPVDPEAVEKNWRELYYYAWTDFHRFLKGWSPGHWKINSYSERVTKEVLSQIKRAL